MFTGVKINRVNVVLLACYVPSSPDICPYQILSSYLKQLWPAQDFGIRGDKYIMEKVRVLLDTRCLLVFIYASIKY